MENNHINKFLEIYNRKPTHVFSCGGRFEVLGNHTDHNHGLCLAATCNLAITEAVAKRDDLKVNVYSEGYKPFSLDLNNLKVHEHLKGKSKELIRGIAAYLKERHYNIGGFDLYMTSTIFQGAGVSSSAAFELAIAEIFNYLFNEDKIDRMLLCKAGQFAENVYFGKKSGLLDQIGVGYGGLVYIDFKDIENPKVETLEFPFDDLTFVIVNTGGSHAHRSHLYAKIPEDMRTAAKSMGVNYLREGNLEKLVQNKDILKEIEFNRALHFYQENDRVSEAVQAIRNKDEETFINAINESRVSSTKLLKNMMVEEEYEGSPLEACDIALKYLKGKGAIKINGGGFSGSCIAVVKNDILDDFIEKMAQKYGKQNVAIVSVRDKGPVLIEKI